MRWICADPCVERHVSALSTRISTGIALVFTGTALGYRIAPIPHELPVSPY
ncbi:hypothetical protein PZE06_15780 [Robertmurraya sp. DFI.2.37]|uniref:hypothetical protein n=1 Tax=Robertmurraya sp. DFI.2.37 TaxID=3031819 RepID=UPI00178007D5|nr:hypothetical protein [Robertmurraya sp. DFI.2.37]MDF1509602.1 hypothetical protein [Robertmurraya sp. DFI.2.37]